MSNTGTSFKFTITNQQFSSAWTGSTSKYELPAVNPPRLSGHKASHALTKWVNPYPDIAFEKIILPQWQGVSKYTRQISNQPDYIKDYHFISLMRCIDFYIKPSFQAGIYCTVDGIKAASDIYNKFVQQQQK